MLCIANFSVSFDGADNGNNLLTRYDLAPGLCITVDEKASVGINTTDPVQDKASRTATEENDLSATQRFCLFQPDCVALMPQKREHTVAGNKEGNFRSAFQERNELVTALQRVYGFYASVRHRPACMLIIFGVLLFAAAFFAVTVAISVTVFAVTVITIA